MRCPDCNKFVGYDEPQCEVNSVEVSDGTVTASVTVSLNCQDCGTTLKDAEIEADASFDHACEPDAKPVEGYAAGDNQYEVESDGDAEGMSRMETTNAKGKPIKPRYAKTFYGFTLEPEIVCRKCGQSIPVTLEGEEQASGFNECC